jgi:hypothetical protein
MLLLTEVERQGSRGEEQKHGRVQDVGEGVGLEKCAPQYFKAVDHQVDQREHRGEEYPAQHGCSTSPTN